ncbi:MAG TPA: hypothetical protein VID68_12545 [Solirubrobacteraceae bacterium]|jgi:hypothetical protein
MKAALGSFAAAAILGLGAVSASAAPNPGEGTPGYPVVAGFSNPAPTSNNPFEQTENGPQTANVPTLAWVGEDVRLVACDNAIEPLPFGGQFQQAEWNTNLWTGDQATQGTPTFDGSQATNLFITNQGSAYFFAPNAPDNAYEKGCVSADISSLHPGLDTVTLNVYSESLGGNNNGLNGGPVQTPVYSEQFNVIWMTANAPKLSEASLSSIEFPTQAGDNGATSTAQFPDPRSPSTIGGTSYTATGQLSALGVYNAGQFLGDTAVLNQFGLDAWGADTAYDPNSWDHGANNTPATNNGLIQVRVTGSFPIEDLGTDTTNADYFSHCGCVVNGWITLPNSWVPLANLLAASSTQNTSNNGVGGGQGGNLWDIHGGPTNTLTHASTGSNSDPCRLDSANPRILTGPLQSFGASIDAVDSCANDGTGSGNGGNAFSFSRVFGDMTQFGTIGPYDPLASNGTLLSDGRLNNDDAPMPALPVTLTIGKGGVGGLYGVSKYLVYSHDFTGNASPTDPDPQPLTTSGLGNLYNPFYQEYIPSTLRGISEASGITGAYEGGRTAGSGDTFPGFSQGWTDPYTFWKALNVSTTDTAGSNGCLRRLDVNNDPGPGYYQLPYYPTQLTVYTDERGEAYVDYNPGTGFPTPPVAIDKDYGCDLQGLLGKNIGTSVISAQTQYPYESVPFIPPAGANTITKNVVSKWSKTLTAYPKDNLSSADVSVVVATATDVNGQPFANEIVCFSAPGASLVIDAGKVVLPNGTVVDDGTGHTAATPYGVGTTFECGRTGDDGTIAVDVSGSAGGADVVAFFWNEDLYRDVNIPTLGQQSTVTSTTPPTVIPAFRLNLDQGSTNSGTVTTPTAPSAPGIAITPLAIGHGASCKVAALHMFAKRGYATVRLSCTGTKSDYVMIRAFKGHKLVRTFKVKLRAGKTARIHFAKGHRITVSPA